LIEVGTNAARNVERARAGFGGNLTFPLPKVPPQYGMVLNIADYLDELGPKCLTGRANEQRPSREKAHPNLLYTNSIDFEFIRHGATSEPL
jgi:hypothetical protein